MSKLHLITAAAALAFITGSAQAGAALPIVSGFINEDGTQQLPSAQYTVLHDKKGKYEIDFTNPQQFSPNPVCIVQPIVKSVLLAGLIVHHRQCVVWFEDLATRKPIDVVFAFVAVPISN